MGGLGRATAVVLLAAAMATARLSLEREASDVGRVRNPAWLPNGRQLRAVSLGQRLLLSDFYWLKLVQYMGETIIARESRWEAVYPLADIVTDLDPRYGYAYQVAGSNLSGLAGRYAEADRILEKGLRNVPERWSLPFVLAVNKFLYEGDFAGGAAYARRAAEIGKRPHLALLAANLALVTDQDGEYRTAIEFLRESLRQAETPGLRAELEARITKVQTYATISVVERAVRAFRERNFRRPVSVEELVYQGYLAKVPRDPAGGRIVYDVAEDEVRSTVLGPRRPIHPGGSQ